MNKNSIGLYRDDGIGVFDKLSGPQIEQRKRRGELSKLLKTVDFQ